MGVSEEILEFLRGQYDQGRGTSNRAIRMSAERVVCELRQSLLAQRWGQQLACSLGKVKSLFSTMWQAKQQENDNLKNETPESRQAQADAMFEENKEAEETILKLLSKTIKKPALKDAQLVHFSKLYAGPLKAFIRIRVLEDASSSELKKMPNKGSLKAAENEAKSDTPGLIWWAYNLRNHPVKAKRFELESVGDENTEKGFRSDRQLYDTAINMQMEETAIDLLSQEEIEDDIQEVESDDDKSDSSEEEEENIESDEDESMGSDDSDDNEPIYESD